MKLKFADIILILLGIFIIYQLLRIILGGSWELESLILALLIFNLGLTWRLSTKFEGHIAYHRIKDRN